MQGNSGKYHFIISKNEHTQIQIRELYLKVSTVKNYLA